jgi:L-rhamnose-H+ transport protein
MLELGIGFALASGVCNGLFTAPMKLMPRWRWENIWLVFILISCIIGPFLMVRTTVPDFQAVFGAAPPGAVASALLFGFAWGFGAIFFGQSVARLGVSLANTLVIGLSSALGSLVPLAIAGRFGIGRQQILLYLGVAAFLCGVWICGNAGRRRDSNSASTQAPSWTGYVLALGAGIMSAVFNIGYSLALPIAQTGQQLGHSSFHSTNCIWLLMLGAGSLPNIAYCLILVKRNRTGRLFFSKQPSTAWFLSILMGVLWGGSIFLYGAATPLLGDIGPSIGWPLSLAMGLLTANLMGFLLREWQSVAPAIVRTMAIGIVLLLSAIALCALSTKAA